ncbi:MAG TPA: TIGR00282 family metallophosphoesterase [Candidatus Hydrogenedentes bacterium]|nr:TIGR00282 family metallophosphoesterase [Candidatus Hydrogenedentota bacterium]HOH49297.1 TIGR00282 family metallophosphoesterase [Candidatus Hydrogenedentota bacterium]HQL94075.1 TIGR00282 family metallophosphoesterase [Candidatus Hydrogenedentota bacterium]HRZ82130.1 TIGR00282 family metallophosphoesterase [Candidatus Hydrogenedentota bacterium]
MRILFIGDVVGRTGRAAVARILPELRKAQAVDLVVANAENSAAGIGATPATLQELRRQGVDLFTLGNHTWRKKELLDAMDGLACAARPANFPDGVPGRGAVTATLADGRKAAVLNLVGRVYMDPADCPFAAADRILPELRKVTPVILVDFHAEATSEKAALGWHLDGRCSAVIGTHTHVQTADEWILPGGTAFLSDAGMTGPAHSIIGMKRGSILEKFVRGIPGKFEVAEGPSIFSAVLVEVDDTTGKAQSITRILLRDPK